MEANQRYAWMFFGLAACCALAASAYAVMGNNKSDAAPSPSADEIEEPVDQPGYVPVMPVAPTVAPSQPATITSSAPTAVPTVPVAVAYTAPGGWVWNPLYTNGVYWDVRYDPHWRYDWRWGRRDNWRYGGDWKRHRS